MNKILNKKIENFNSITFKPLFRKIVGWNEMEEKIDTIHYYLNTCFDIHNVPKATGVLRLVQLADSELLRIVTEILEENSITYWLDSGTLLGAVRHKGFIPWDDDLDIAIPRNDYDRACKILPSAFEKVGITPNIDCKYTGHRLTVTIWVAGLTMDIHPIDCVSSYGIDNNNELIAKLNEFCRFKSKHNYSEERMKSYRETIIGIPDYENPLWFYGKNIYENNLIFPLKKLSFEMKDYYVPNDSDTYLRVKYGDYMSFPRDRILHHRASGKGVHNNSIKHNIDLVTLYDALKRIHLLK